MPFVTNFPRRSRPRGLGYAGMDGVAGPLSGLGTWVVDTEYGLGPRFREGYNRPYPVESMPTRWPRAQAARVLGPSQGNVVARPYAATRASLTRYPVRMAPISAPGARLRNPGVAGYGITDTLDQMAAVSDAIKQPGVYGPVAGGIVLGLGSRVLPKGGTRTAAGWGALAAMGYGIYALVQAAGAAGRVREREAYERTIKDTGSGTVTGARAGHGGVMGAVEGVILAGADASDSVKLPVLQMYAQYESARRSNTWWGRLRGTARDPLHATSLTPEQLQKLIQAFNLIPRPDRRRLHSAYAKGGSFEDLG